MYLRHTITITINRCRHADSLLKKAKEGDVEAVNAIFGTFACQASNIAGVGEKCSISIDGPPSALVADTDTTYLIFGGASVVLLLFIIVTSIILCRRHSVTSTKYETGINRVPQSHAATATTTAVAAGAPSSGTTALSNADFSVKKSAAQSDQEHLNDVKTNNANGISLTSFQPVSR